MSLDTNMPFINLRSAAVAGVVVSGMAGSVAAMPIDFAVDLANSSVEITDQSGGGILCSWTNCGISATLAPGLGSTAFTLDEDVGVTSSTFDFIRFEGDGTTFSGRDFSIQATLALDPPGSTTSSGGSGAGFLLFGSIIGGILTWDNVPQLISLSDGPEYIVDFEHGARLLFDGDAGYTSTASVQLISTAPLGAGALFLGTALAGLGVARAARRRTA